MEERRFRSASVWEFKVSELFDTCRGGLYLNVIISVVLSVANIFRPKPYDSGFRAQNVASLQL